MKISNDIDFISFIGQQESQELHWSDHWEDELVAHVAGTGEAKGDLLPWTKTHQCVQLRPGELSIWAGINGHRKSMILGQVMAWLAQDTRVCIASLEMKPESTLKRMCRQVAGCYPSESFARQFVQWGHERICLYDQLDQVEAEKILGVVHYAAKELKCTHVVIDSLMKCGMDDDNYNGQKELVDRLAWCAKATGVHVHLVCHMRKGRDESEKPGKFDVLGASAITNLADNVFVCWADKKVGDLRQKQANGLTLTDKEVELLDKPDQILRVAKQRHGEYEGDFNLWFDDKSLQFVGNKDRRLLDCFIKPRRVA